MVNSNPPASEPGTAPGDLAGQNDAATDADELRGECVTPAESAGRDSDPLDNSADPVVVVAALRNELEQVRADNESQREQALRAVAEADNVRKRAQRDLDKAHKFALERFVTELLPVKDSLELGLAAARDSANVDDLIEGTQMTLRMLCTAIEKFGVREIHPVGEPFDPQLHQAMTTRDADGQPAGTVLEVVQKGYSLNERLVRPAMVVVSK
jgi:molecular chaperone GrpE